MKCLILSMLLIVTFAPVAAKADAVLSVFQLSGATTSPGGTYTVDIEISNVQDLYDFQFDLDFNPTVLNANDINEGVFLPTGGATFFIPGSIDNTLGSISFNADTLLGSGPGVSGVGTLATTDFSVVGIGVSDLTLSNVILQDSLGNNIPFTIQNASVTSSSTVAPVPEPGTLALFGSGVLLLLHRRDLLNLPEKVRRRQ